jgi:hypothetical protein
MTRVIRHRGPDRSAVFTEAEFSRHERYPEYAFHELATRKNPVDVGIREVLRMSEADSRRYSSPHWNPLGKRISKGDRAVS